MTQETKPFDVQELMNQNGKAGDLMEAIESFYKADGGDKYKAERLLEYVTYLTKVYRYYNKNKITKASLVWNAEAKQYYLDIEGYRGEHKIKDQSAMCVESLLNSVKANMSNLDSSRLDEINVMSVIKKRIEGFALILGLLPEDIDFKAIEYTINLKQD